jgi:F-type H+-transporting ATPase subunit alpha
VGGNAQIPAMKSSAGGLRLQLASFRALEAFAQLGTELDKETQRELDRGYRMVEILKQRQFEPMNVADQVMIIFAGTKGYLDKVERPKVQAWEQAFLKYMRESKAAVRDALQKSKKMTPEIDKQLTEAITAFQSIYKG